MSVSSFILSILYSNRCRLCNTRTGPLCASCIHYIPFDTYTPDRNTIAFYAYRKGGLKRVLWLLKYHHQRSLAYTLGTMLADVLVPELEERVRFENFSNPVLLPIPLSKKSLRARGYNQVTEIARALVARGHGELVLIDNTLIKTKDTKRQARCKNRSDRFTNLRGAFSIQHPELITGRNVIILDDVTTTGATLEEATKVVLKAKPRSVLRVALAH